MKKILLFFFIGSTLLAASCTKNYTEVTPNQTLTATLASSDWTTDDNGLNYTTTVTPPEKGAFGSSSDGILIYLPVDDGKTYEQVPEVYNNVSYTYTNDGGVITLFAQSANGAETIDVPPPLGVKIIVVPSN